MNDHSYLIPTAEDLPHPLGRHVNHDPANSDFRALTRPPERVSVPFKAWPSVEVFDQGDSSRCTCEAAVGLLRTGPFAHDFTERADYDQPFERESLYFAAQEQDPWPGHNYDGTSTDAPFKVLRSAGVIPGWKWLFGEDEVREWVSWYSPVVVGTVWHMGMFYPDTKSGLLTVQGEVVGGHAYRLVQYSQIRDAYRVVNSWGRGWGQRGRAWLRSSDLAALLANDGDAVTL